ncbi:hypothetical protein MN608_06124 [Microdochium nivale]|nr:hypothetical protein MN608_06124 [Microdochium nivale]
MSTMTLDALFQWARRGIYGSQHRCAIVLLHPASRNPVVHDESISHLPPPALCCQRRLLLMSCSEIQANRRRNPPSDVASPFRHLSRSGNLTVAAERTTCGDTARQHKCTQQRLQGIARP